MKSFQNTFLYVAITLAVLFLATVISPFLTTLILAAVLVTGMYPVYEWVHGKLKGHTRAAALVMASSIGVIFSVVFFMFFVLLSQEAVETYQGIEKLLREGKFNLNEFITTLSSYLEVPASDIISSITQALENFSSSVVAQSTNLIKSLVWLILNFFLLVFAMYFFFKDGKFMVESVQKIIPLPVHYGREIFQKFEQVSLAMLYGVFLTAIAQGILGGIGLAVAGINNPILWGTVMAFFGMLPIGGTGIVWLPASLYLLATEQYVAGIGLLLWGSLIVALVDNFIKPLVISKQTKTYPLATFLVVIGGLMVFGLKGAIIAPMVLAATVSLIHIYKMENATA